jgi:hypothetical protein
MFPPKFRLLWLPKHGNEDRLSMDLPSDPVDFLIVGGGSAGCALASRLSEDAATRVLLAEAGREVTPADIPALLASHYRGRTYF